MSASNPLIEMLDQVFPSIRPPRTPDVWDRIIEADTKRAAYVAETVPQLVRMYQATPDRVVEAVGHLEHAMRDRRHPLLSALLTRDDHAEIGRLLLAAIDERLADVANDAAEESGYDVFPEPSL
jgi:hypothetical protein